MKVVAMPIQKPAYDNQHLRDFRTWFEANEQRLGAWYDTCGQFCTPEGDDFFSFAACQHDLELMRAQQ